MTMHGKLFGDVTTRSKDEGGEMVEWTEIRLRLPNLSDKQRQELALARSQGRMIELRMVR